MVPLVRHRARRSQSTIAMLKIISGGQTGVDRAALDVALKHQIECGGWCPAGRLDELGKIPNRYPVTELDRGGFAERTLANVRESDGTVILHLAKVQGGTEFTLNCCKELKRPCKLIDAAKMPAAKAAAAIVGCVREHKIRVLNVAGPRQSQWAGGYDYAFRALDIFLSSIMSTSTTRKKRATRSAGPSPGRGARRSRRESARPANRSRTR